MARVDISELSSVSEKLAERLSRAGFDSANIMLEADKDDILGVNGVGPVKFKQMLKESGNLVRERALFVEKERERAEAEKDPDTEDAE